MLQVLINWNVPTQAKFIYLFDQEISKTSNIVNYFNNLK